ncbi:MAG: GNAT family N-acetyltransferase [Lachnospiraceae bacterium]|nr:GNAT family N-acetyltransferase [Lachnospiraceae bacterium]
MFVRRENEMLNHKGTKEIRTSRLILRKYKISDAQDMFKNYASDERVTKFLNWRPYDNAEEILQFLEMSINDYKKENTYHWAIQFKGEIIGSIFAMFVNDLHKNCEVGYCIGYDFWNKGLTSEAFSGVIQFLFEEVGMHRIMAKHDVENPASGEVMKKCGLTYEGRMKEYYLRYDGTYSDSLIYGIINSNAK